MIPSELFYNIVCLKIDYPLYPINRIYSEIIFDNIGSYILNR